MAYSCKDKRCKLCPAIDSVGPFTSSQYNSYICKLNNCVYMIRCGICNIKYIGQTSNPLNLRINNHRNLCCREKVDDNNLNLSISKYILLVRPKLIS